MNGTEPVSNEHQQDIDIAVIKERLKKVDAIHEAIVGNGKVGMKVTQAVQQSRLRIAYIWMTGLTSWFFAGKL